VTDEAARRRIAEDLDATLFVEAGAGTGKTTALVERVVRLVATGRVTDLARLAAITFTEAAAAELRERVRAGLEDAAADPTLPADERARCAEGAATVDDAAVTTLHGFAARILAEHPLEAGVPPGFDVVDEVAERVEVDERWQAFLGELLAEPSLEAALLRAFALRLSTAHLRAVADAFHASWDRLVDVDLAVQAPPPVGVSPVVEALDTACEHVGRHPDDDNLARYLAEEVAPFRERLVAAAGGDETDVLRALDSARLRPGRRGTAAVWGPDKAAVLAAVERAEEIRSATLAAARQAALTALLPPLRQFVLGLAAERRAAGRLAFHDLLVLARDLLRHSVEVRVGESARWDRILLDEFQDTDPLQIEIAALLALVDPAADPPPPWDEARLVPGKLFLVGDPKQSIYRFRRADIALYDRAAVRFNGGLVRLSRNFRTVPSVLAWVNRAFGSIIGTGEAGAQPAYVDLEASRDEVGGEGGGPAVAVVGGGLEGASMAVVREREATAVADLVVRMRDDGWPVMVDGDRSRPLRFADIALLVPTRTPLGAIERALEAADVPYRIESRSLAFATDEVRELLAVLEAVDDPGDEVAVVAALRSPGFACADDELAEWRAAGGSWHPRRPPPEGLPADHPVATAMAAIAALHDRRWWEPVPELVARVVRERRLVELTTAHARPRDHWRRLRFLTDQARAWAEAGGLTLGGFLAWARRQADEDARILEVVAPEEDDDAVRILTVHGAKGLEFPAVVLAGLGGGADPRSATVLWSDAGPEVAVGAKGSNRFETPGYDDHRLTEARMEELESHRLLYVAATRARDHLIVSLFHKPTGNGRRSAAELLSAHCDAGCRRLDPPEPEEPEPSAAAVAVSVPVQRPVAVPSPAARPPASPADVAAARDGWLATVTPALARTHRPPTVVATALADLAAGLDPDDASSARAPEARPDDAALARPPEPDFDDAVVARPPEPDFDDAALARPPEPDFDDAVVARPAEPELDDASRARPARPEQLVLLDLHAPAPEPAPLVPAAVPASGGVYGGSRPGDGAAVGRAVHATLQSVDLATGEHLADLAAAAAAHERIPERAGLVAALADAARRAPVVQQAVRGGRWWREVPVAAPVGGGVVEGVVDLLVERPDGGLVVVDYKTDAVVGDDELDAAVGHHRLQAAAYAAALESALDRPVSRAVLVFARPDGPVEREVPELRAAVEEVMRLVATTASPATAGP
jgi:ATP-dependent helicase/nuclease subunit A